MRLTTPLRVFLVIFAGMIISFAVSGCAKKDPGSLSAEQRALALVAAAQTTQESIPASVTFEPLSFSGMSNEGEPSPLPPVVTDPAPLPQPTAEPSQVSLPQPPLIAIINQAAPTPTMYPVQNLPENEPEQPTSLPVSASMPISGQVATSAPRFGFPEAESNPFAESPAEVPAEPAQTAAREAPLYTPVIVNPNADGSNWQKLPVVPDKISQTAKDIYQYGVKELGRNGRFFSKIGDCHSFANVFLGEYDYQAGSYQLSDSDLYLEHAINYFQGAFNEMSYAVSNGMSAASALTTIWSDPYACNHGESALLCEVRIHNPSIIFINLGTNWVIGTDTSVYEGYLDEIVYKLIQRGILPIMTTKADNIERNYDLNRITVMIAQKYDLPVFNFWAQAQTLPNGGLDATRDNIHLAPDAWPIRSYWALKVLYAVGNSLGLF